MPKDVAWDCRDWRGKRIFFIFLPLFTWRFRSNKFKRSNVLISNNWIGWICYPLLYVVGVFINKNI